MDVSGIDVYVLNANTAFSIEVFKIIGPHVPRGKWPINALHVPFTPSADGLYLIGKFKDLPAPYAGYAAQLVAQAGTKLVLKSPAAWRAARMVKAKRWRDACMFAAVPALFAIPLFGALSRAALLPAAALFVANLVALILTQLALTKARTDLVNTRFVADIPVPGLRLGGVIKQEEPPPTLNMNDEV
ncbi:conserved hypothetical protein [Magnetospirillum sp. LM-5]|nr:conserved hypothetical protein [Magnetospirillum sp. LM-5]